MLTHDLATLARRPLLATLSIATCLTAAGCDRGAQPAPAPAPQAAAAPTAAPAEPASPAATPQGTQEAPKEEVKIMVEKWENGKTKFWNEMRRDANGKWQKNGLGRAYYASGVLEREGMYKDGKRVGRWQFYDAEGKPSMVDERGDGTLPGTR
jgi:hypothetical protein